MYVQPTYNYTEVLHLVTILNDNIKKLPSIYSLNILKVTVIYEVRITCLFIFQFCFTRVYSGCHLSNAIIDTVPTSSITVTFKTLSEYIHGNFVKIFSFKLVTR